MLEPHRTSPALALLGLGKIALIGALLGGSVLLALLLMSERTGQRLWLWAWSAWLGWIVITACTGW